MIQLLSLHRFRIATSERMLSLGHRILVAVASSRVSAALPKA